MYNALHRSGTRDMVEEGLSHNVQKTLDIIIGFLLNFVFNSIPTIFGNMGLGGGFGP